MAENELGMFATSNAGHDKCKLYVIIKADSEYVYLVDGKNRTIKNPKKKSRKHIQILKDVDEAFIMMYNKNKVVNNEDIKRAIKLYLAKGEV